MRVLSFLWQPFSPFPSFYENLIIPFLPLTSPILILSILYACLPGWVGPCLGLQHPAFFIHLSS